MHLITHSSIEDNRGENKRAGKDLINMRDKYTHEVSAEVVVVEEVELTPTKAVRIQMIQINVGEHII